METFELEIRPATELDIPAIMALIRTVVPLMIAAGNLQWDKHYPNPEAFLRDVELGQLWIAVMADTLVGVAAITTDQEPEYAQLGWDLSQPAIVTHRLAVDPDVRGKGIAAALLRQAETVARRRGIDILRIDTNTQNRVTQSLFPKLGYVLVGEISLSFREGLRFLCYENRLS